MRADTTAALLALLCLAAGAGAVLAAPAVASHVDEANYTIQPEDPASDRAPNASDATYDLWVEAEEPYENVTHITYRLPEKAFYDCRPDDIREFGIDRGDTHSGLETDEEPSTVYRDFDGYYFEIEVDGSFDLSTGDEVVASVADCLFNPEEEAWYYGQFYLYDQDDVMLQSKSHYYWICECDNESEARERLGPPPSETSTTPTPTPTDEPVVTEEQTPEPTKTESDASTATSTKAGAGTPTSTETSQISAASSSPTETASADGTASPEQTAGATGTGTATPGESAAVSSAADDEVTPGGGPGFGALVAVIALAAVALLARRRG